MFKENPELDMYFTQVLNTVFLNICSPKALDELNKLIPDKVDRYNHNGVEEVNIVRNSFGLMPSTSNWELRRKIATKTIGINFASKYIPMMILKVDEWSEGVKIGENLNLTVEITKITFKVIMNILFGKDMHKIEKWEYYSPKDGSLSILSFEDAYLRYAKDIVDAKYIGLSKLIPFLATINITEPFKSTERNRKTIYSTLRKFVNMSEDEQSV